MRKTSYESSATIRCLRVFKPAARRRLYLSLTAQVFLNLLDLFGVALIGLIGAMSVRGIQSGGNPESIESILRILRLDTLTFQQQIAVLAVAATVTLLAKTLISIVTIKRILSFMSAQSAEISTRLYKDIISRSVVFIDTVTPQNILFSVTAGVSKISLGVIGNLITLLSDSALLLLMFVTLLFVDLSMTLSIGVFFGIAVALFHLYVRNKAEKLGKTESRLNVKSNTNVLEGLVSYRERYARGTLDNLVNDFRDIRVELSDTLAESTFLPNITKYVVETLVIVGALLISGVQFALNDAGQAIATLSVFIGAATRVAPAIMRMQQSLIQIKNSSGAAESTLRLIELLKETETKETVSKDTSTATLMNEAINLRSVNFSYPNSSEPALENINLTISRGESVAIVGPSGGGKSTLADVILGLVTPDSGDVSLNGVEPQVIFENKPCRIAFVPQKSSLMSGTLRQNLLLGLNPNSFTDEKLTQTIESVGLSSEFERLNLNLDSSLGDFGAKLSGGQLQRIGIARALVTDPLVLILDEATSALDASSENQITQTLEKLRSKVTLIVIAHRLSTIRKADKIYYLDRGKILASGTFDELRAKIPNFDEQANLMGL